MLLYWIILLYILISPISSQCERPALTCSALTQTVTIWGGSATGLILGQYTNDQLLFVGCSNNICTFSCVQAVDSMTFRSLNAYPYRMLAVLGPSPIPSFGAFACATSTTPYNVIDAPDVASSINKLCQQIGYKVGTFTSWSGNRCPSVLWDGTSWTSDWISTDGVVTQSITCSQKCTAAPTKNPTNMPTNTPTNHPTNTPTNNPTNIPTFSPLNPTFFPTKNPTLSPTTFPTTKLPTHIPTSSIPTNKPTNKPTEHPVIVQPTNIPTNKPTNRPTKSPININIATITIQLHDEAVQESTAITNDNSNVDNGVSKNDINSSMAWIIVIALIFALIASVICLLLIIGVWYARKRKAKNLQRYMQDKQRQRQCVRVVSSSDVVATPSGGFDSQSPAVLTVNTLGKIYGNVHGMVDGVELGSMLSVTSVGSDLDFDMVSTPGNDDFKQTCTAVHVNVGSISPIAMGEDDCGLNDNTGNVDCLRLSSVTPGNIDTGVPLRENEFVVNASEEAMDEFDEIDAIDNIENVETKGSGEFDDNEGDDMMMVSSYVNNVTPY